MEMMLLAPHVRMPNIDEPEICRVLQRVLYEPVAQLTITIDFCESVLCKRTGGSAKLTHGYPHYALGSHLCLLQAPFDILPLLTAFKKYIQAVTQTVFSSYYS